MTSRSFVPRFFCILALIVSTFTITSKTEAQLVVKDPFNLAPNIMQMVNTVQNTTKELGLDGIAKMIAQQIVKQITRSIVTWINSGFDGNPSFVSDPEGFLQNTVDQVTGEFLSKTGLNFLCEPFRLNVRLALVLGVGGRSDFKNQYKCTLSGIIKNAEGFSAFMQGQFSANGGWNSWFQITQNNSNNPIGAYIGAKGALEAKIGDKKLIESQKLDWGRGFMSWETCDQTYKDVVDSDTKRQQSGNSIERETLALQNQIAEAKDAAVKAPSTNKDAANQRVRALEAKLASLNAETRILTEAYGRTESGVYGPTQNGGNISSGSIGDCAKKSVKTPGSVIESQLNGVLPKELEGIVTADEINEIIGALASQLLTKTITGFQGLAGTSNPRNGNKSILEEYEEEKSPNIASLKRQITNQIKRARTQIGSARYLRLKKLSLSYLSDMEEAQKLVVACYVEKKSINPSDRTLTNRLNEATSILTNEIVILKNQIERDIQGAGNQGKDLDALEKDLATASTPGELERIQFALQDITEGAADAEGQKTSLQSQRDDAIEDSKADLAACEAYQGNGGEIDPSTTSPVNGYLDAVTSDYNVTGWACDPDQPANAVKVSFYSSPTKEVSYGETMSTSLAGEDEIAKYCGGNSAHRFIYSLPSYIRSAGGEVHAFVLEPSTNIEYRLGNFVTMPKTVVQNEKPLIIYTGFVPTSQKVGQKIELWLMALDKEKGPMTYTVFWGDESTNPAADGVFVGNIGTTIEKTSHTYIAAGNYSVKVTVTDDAGGSTTTELPLNVGQ